MALLNPVNGLVVPFLFIVTVPLAILASITTMLAFSVLMFRVMLVYFDLAVQLVPLYVFGRPQTLINERSAAVSPVSRLSSGHSSPTTPHPPTHLGDYRAIPRSRSTRRRRPSSASAASAGTITPKSENGAMAGGAAPIPSVGVDRDFEGVGGWRLDDDENWTRINSRLELPVDRTTLRHHQRSQSGGPTTLGEGSWLLTPAPPLRKVTSPSEKDSDRLAVSPNSSRTRIATNVPPPLTTAESSGSYFSELTFDLGRKVAA